MRIDKSPGVGGLSLNLYRCLWDKISDLVIDSLNEGYEKGELSDTQKIGFVSLIYK